MMFKLKTALLLTACGAFIAAPTFASQKTEAAPAKTKAAMQLHDGMRKLWTDHVVWTRDYIVAAVDGTPDADAAAARLMKNQEDIGSAVASYYGKAAGDQ